MTKIEKIKIKNWTYEGQVKKGQPHGKGILKGRGLYPIEINRFDKDLNNKIHKFKYEGSFQNGKMHGYGVLNNYDTTFINRSGQKVGSNRVDSKYKGEFRLGYKHGQGTWWRRSSGKDKTYLPPWIYSGQWHKNKWRGKGTLKSGQTIYSETLSGIWDKNEECHKGTWICKGNDQILEYDGEFTIKSSSRITNLKSPNGRGVLKVIDKKLKLYFIIESTEFFLSPHNPTGKTIVTFYVNAKFKDTIVQLKLNLGDYGLKTDNSQFMEHPKLYRLYRRCWNRYHKARTYDH